MQQTQYRLGALWRSVSCCILWFYLTTAAPLAPALAGLLALSDVAHELMIGQTDNQISLVLHHRKRPDAAHKHGIVAAALTQLSSSQPLTENDHVIRFTSSVAELNGRLTGDTVCKSQAAFTDFTARVANPPASTRPTCIFGLAAPSRSPLLGFLRSIELVI